MPVKKNPSAPGWIDERDLRLEEERWRIKMELSLDRMKLERQKDELHREIPHAWRDIETNHPVTPKKVRVTTALDADVAKFFRATGRGYQAKMNDVLRLYMLARLSKYIEAPEDRTWEGDAL